ncbi:MAG: DinB family protein [Anaerolineales bacterium]
MRSMIGPADRAAMRRERSATRFSSASFACARAEMPSGASKAMMLAALEAAEIELLATLAAIPAKRRSTQPVCGHWTTLQLVGHLADWDVYFLNWLTELCGGTSLDLHYDNDGDRFNQWLQDQRKGQPWKKVWHDFRENRRCFVERLRQVPERKFLAKQKSMPYPTIYHCAWSALEHYLDHAAGVRREAKMDVPAEFLHFHGPYTD